MRCHSERDGQARGPRARFDARASGVRLIVLAAAIGVAGGACGSSGTATQPNETTTTATSTTEPRWSTDEQGALDAYQGYLDVVDEALTAPLDSTVPELDQYATPEAAEDIRLRVAGFELLGRAVRPETRFEAETVTVDGDGATIVGCLSDAGVVYEVTTGTVVNDNRVRHVATTTLLRTADDSWLVTGSDGGRPGVRCDA